MSSLIRIHAGIGAKNTTSRAGSTRDVRSLKLPGLLRMGCASPFPRSKFRPDVTCGPWRPVGAQ